MINYTSKIGGRWDYCSKDQWQGTQTFEKCRDQLETLTFEPLRPTQYDTVWQYNMYFLSHTNK